MVFEGAWGSNSEMKQHGDVWHETDGQEEHWVTDGQVGIDETVEKLVKTNGVHWYGHNMRDEDDDIRKVLRFKVPIG